MVIDNSKRKALVTGATSGIGFAAAKGLLETGADVYNCPFFPSSWGLSRQADCQLRTGFLMRVSACRRQLGSAWKTENILR
jgi:nucleoside-diphosphate-sugar epimerase